MRSLKPSDYICSIMFKCLYATTSLSKIKHPYPQWQCRGIWRILDQPLHVIWRCLDWYINPICYIYIVPSVSKLILTLLPGKPFTSVWMNMYVCSYTLLIFICFRANKCPSEFNAWSPSFLYLQYMYSIYTPKPSAISNTSLVLQMILSCL